MKRLTAPTLLEQIKRLQGNISAIARAFGVDRSAVIKYIKKRPELETALKDCREALVDNAESALGVSVAAREPWAVCFTLKCLGKDRGYVERQEIDNRISGGLAVQFVEEIVEPESNDNGNSDEAIGDSADSGPDVP